MTTAAPRQVQDALLGALEDIRSGLGHAKTPEEFGAFPTDAYSHTPRGRGARQPGMTGQVKEDLLIRWHELGLRWRGGELALRPDLVADREWLSEPGELEYVDVAGRLRQVPLGADTLALTWCQTPLVYHRDGPREVRMTGTVPPDRAGVDPPGSSCQELMARTGSITRIDVYGGARPALEVPALWAEPPTPASRAAPGG